MKAIYAIVVVTVVTAVVATQPLQEPFDRGTLDGRPVINISNDKLSLALRAVGGSMVRLLMKDDSGQLNPFEGLGHFVCVDGFGPVSKEEEAARLPGHGEAHRVPWDVVSSGKEDGTLTVQFSAALPLVHENFRRTLRLVDGESVIYIDSELESLLAFDRPINWGEHATISGAFLEQGKTVTDMSATRAMTRSYESEAVDPPDHHNLADFKEFKWPMAPTVTGTLVDMRISPTIAPVMDQTTSLMDPSRRLAYVTALHPERKALLGYVFRREEYPWIQIWDSYPGGGRRSYRGMEFAVQPFDLPRRDVIQTNSMFDTPTYRWLPAQSKITSSFIMFYTRTPDGFSQVDDVRIENDAIAIEDRRNNKRITLKVSRSW
ncbi:MAG TPA: hypothetical protein VFT39_19205 [Vicinamibacterales bacterium]|nr:hypothetical protein [Vicinamibacterales bacterium]